LDLREGGFYLLFDYLHIVDPFFFQHFELCLHTSVLPNFPFLVYPYAKDGLVRLSIVD